MAVNKNKDKIVEVIIAEIEIQTSLFYPHTLSQLSKLNEYLDKSERYQKKGFLVVPYKCKSDAKNLVDSQGYDNILIKGEKIR